MGLILLPGTCSQCGCTDDNACAGGCSWVDEDHTLCSACAEPDVDHHSAEDYDDERHDFVIDDTEIGGLT